MTSRLLPVALPLALAAVCLLVNAAVPLLSALLLAMVLGVLVANLRPGPLQLRAAASAKHLLRAGVVLLGLRLSLAQLGQIGWRGAVVVLATVAATFLGTRWLGRRLGLEEGLTTLVAAGFAICGAAAVATVSQQVRARQRDVALALALVTVYGTVMIAVVPWASGLLGLTEQDAAAWAGASIHEVAQVVAAASLLGPGALAVATTVKLARVVMLAPVTALVGGRGARVPWFVTGFVLAVLLRSTGRLPEGVLAVADQAATLLLAAGMVGLGLGIRLRELWPVPGRVLGLGAASTVVAAGVPLAVLAVLPA